MRSRFLALVAIVGVSVVATPLLAHHALQAEFDTAKRGAIDGTLTKFSLVNPHVRWYFDVNKGGTVEKWELIGAGAGAVRDAGMSRTFKPGEHMKATFAPARDGSNLGRVVTFTFDDGREITMYHEDPNNPNDR